MQLTAPGNPPVAVVPAVILQLDPPPPAILWAVDDPPKNTSTDPNALPPAPIPVTASTPAQLGDTVTLLAYGLSLSTGTLPGPGAVWVNIEGNQRLPGDGGGSRCRAIPRRRLRHRTTPTSPSWFPQR